MRRAIQLALVLGALVAPSAAQAHDGGVWFTTRKAVAANVEGKYRLDVYKDCIPTSSANKTETNDFGGVSYDHFFC